MSKFTWVTTHKAIAEKFLAYENRQNELIDILRNAGETILNDIDTDGQAIPLQEIDPFSFFCYIYKYGPIKRLQRLRQVAEAFNIEPLPEDEHGIPSANAQKVWLFPYKNKRTNNEIARLWSFFKAAINNQLNNDLFQDVIKISGTGQTKITEGLFYIDPEKYLPINAQSRPYLEEVMGIDPRFKTLLDYLRVLQRVKAKTDDPFYKISYDAYVWNTTRPLPEEIGKAGAIDQAEQEKENFPVHELVLVETLSDIDQHAAVELFYKKFDVLISRAGITPDQVHGGVRSDKRIPITLGRRYVYMLKRRGDQLIWGLIFKAEDEELATSHASYDNSSFFRDRDGGQSYCWVEFVVPVKQNDPGLHELWDKWLDAASAYYHEIKDTQLRNTYKRYSNEAVIKSLFDETYREKLLNRALAYSGFVVQKKVIEKYKAILKVAGIKNEEYKWEALGKSYWDLEDPDLRSMVKRIPFTNLAYLMAIAVLIHLAETYPEELRNCLRRLFTSDDNLAERVKNFRNAIDGLYKKVNPTLPSHHDERTAATYLAFYDPENYPLYKNSFYAKYCKLLGKRQASTNEKYQHYFELIRDLITNYVRKDEELLRLYEALKLPDGFQDGNLLLLAQDMLYRTFDGRFDELSTLKPVTRSIQEEAIIGTGLTVGDAPSHEEKEEEDEEPTGSQNFWWLNANPAMWSISNMEVGDRQTYTSRNEKGNKRRIYKYFEAAQKGDMMIGYESTPVKQIKALHRKEPCGRVCTHNHCLIQLGFHRRMHFDGAALQVCIVFRKAD